jgi:hypothetical protein
VLVVEGFGIWVLFWESNGCDFGYVSHYRRSRATLIYRSYVAYGGTSIITSEIMCPLRCCLRGRDTINQPPLQSVDAGRCPRIADDSISASALLQ